MSDVCTPCPAGQFASGYVSTSCSDCGIGKYAVGLANTICQNCPSRFTTLSTRSLDSTYCMNPYLNQTSSLVFLFLASFMIILYLVVGRVRRVAVLRTGGFKFLRDTGSEVYSKVKRLHIQLSIKRRIMTSYGLLRIFVFIVGSCFIVIGTVIFGYASILLRMVFNSFLLSNSAYMDITKLSDLLVSFTEKYFQVIKLPILSKIVKELVDLMSWAFSIKIDLGGMDITCLGANSTLELFVDVVIVMFISFVVLSNVLYIRNFFMAKINTEIIRCTGNFDLQIGRVRQNALLMFTCIVTLVLNVFNIQRLLQFLLNILQISVFFRDNGAHAYTSACNYFVGMENLDSTLALITTAIAYFAVSPILYTMLCICVPRGYDRVKHDTLDVFWDRDLFTQLSNRIKTQENTDSSPLYPLTCVNPLTPPEIVDAQSLTIGSLVKVGTEQQLRKALFDLNSRNEWNVLTASLHSMAKSVADRSGRISCGSTSEQQEQESEEIELSLDGCVWVDIGLDTAEDVISVNSRFKKERNGAVWLVVPASCLAVVKPEEKAKDDTVTSDADAVAAEQIESHRSSNLSSLAHLNHKTLTT